MYSKVKTCRCRRSRANRSPGTDILKHRHRSTWTNEAHFEQDDPPAHTRQYHMKVGGCVQSRERKRLDLATSGSEEFISTPEIYKVLILVLD